MVRRLTKAVRSRRPEHPPVPSAFGALCAFEHSSEHERKPQPGQVYFASGNASACSPWHSFFPIGISVNELRGLQVAILLLN